MTNDTAVTARPAGPDSHAESQDLWDLRNLAEARGQCGFQFEQVPSGFGRRVLEVGAGLGTFTERLLPACAEELLLIDPETACFAELEAKFAADPRVTVRAEVLP